jgi:hypothetical protein
MKTTIYYIIQRSPDGKDWSDHPVYTPGTSKTHMINLSKAVSQAVRPSRFHWQFRLLERAEKVILILK